MNELARAGTVEGLVCWELLDELAEKLPVKLNFSATEVTDTIADLLGFLRLVKITNTLKVIDAGSDDDKILECAVVGGATHIVTGDRRHMLPLGSYHMGNYFPKSVSGDFYRHRCRFSGIGISTVVKVHAR
jgi:predicted nucleic acid-binding protein